MNLPQPAPDAICRATLAYIDLDAVAHNFREIRHLLPTSVAICAIVKADAYGHGAVAVTRELETMGADSFAVATVEEGLQLRVAGIRQPILVMGAGFSGIQTALEHDLTPLIYSPDTARRVSEAARQAKRSVLVHLKLDTGMGRLGLMPEEIGPVLEELRGNPWIRLQGLASHFSSAETDPGWTTTQLSLFEEVKLEILKGLASQPSQVHISNSAAILNHPEGNFTMVRPGILLYGVKPDRNLAPRITTIPAMAFTTRILCVKSFPPGSPIGYGQTFRTGRPSKIAILPAGYADGVRRDLSNLGWVLIRGQRAPIVGTVTMDLTMVDVTDLPGATEGDEVVLFGKTDQGTLPVEELSEAIGAIPYELLCGVSRRVPRIYHRDGNPVDAP